MVTAVEQQAVVRHLPPAMTEQEFLAAVQPLPDHNFFYFAAADHSLGQFAFCRAYINFLSLIDMESFRDKFDGYVFVDSRGNEFPAVVEYAPFQKIPHIYLNPSSAKKKRDKKCGTIEQDADYQSFVKGLEDGKEESLPSAEVYLEEMEARHKEIKANRGCPKVITPLMHFVLAKYNGKSRSRDDRRFDERKQRNRDEKAKHKKTEASAKKEKSDKVEKGDDRTSAHKERRSNPGIRRRERRERRDKKAAAAASDPTASADPITVLQKEKTKEPVRQKPSPSPGALKAPAQVQPKTDAPKSNDVRKPKPERRPPPARKTGQANGEESTADVVNGKSAGSKKERIPNKERPAIPIYRPGAKRSDTGGRKTDGEKNRESGNPNSGNKQSQEKRENRDENRNTDRRQAPKPKGEKQHQPHQQSGPQPKGENGVPFRTKVFKSTRKPTGSATT